MSYESPIRVFVDDMVDAWTAALENDLPKVALHYGIAVDKAELIRALNYDRDQYEKGYADGQKDAVKHVVIGNIYDNPELLEGTT